MVELVFFNVKSSYRIERGESDSESDGGTDGDCEDEKVSGTLQRMRCYRTLQESNCCVNVDLQQKKNSKLKSKLVGPVKFRSFLRLVFQSVSILV